MRFGARMNLTMKHARARGGSGITGLGVHTEDSARDAKIALRRNVLEFVGADRAHVFDAFAGPGEMHAAVWNRAASYVGCDSESFADERRMYVADSRIVLRSLDLAAFNIFDLDHFGCPWEWAWIIANRRPVNTGERIGLVLTDGAGFYAKFGRLTKALSVLAGIDAGASRAIDDARRLASKRCAVQMGAEITRAWYAHRETGAAVRYIALAMTGRESVP